MANRKYLSEEEKNLKPIIGITTYEEEVKGYHTLNTNYINAVFNAGGIPITIPIIHDEEDYDYYLNIIDGIIFSGGIDVSPLSYGENPINEVKNISSIRDKYELGLLKRAYEKKLPILGICRGCQLINVSLGGTLYQDINVQVPNALGHCPGPQLLEELYHAINIKEGTRLHSIFDKKRIYVNSFHHQAINKLGENIKIAAISDDGIVEAIESTDDRFLIGVQFHPEALQKKYLEFQGIFKELINAAK